MRRGETGFTLLEMLIAFAIFSLVLVAVYSSLSTSLRSEAEANAASSHVQIARSVLSEVGHSIPLVAGNPTGRMADGTRWSLDIRPSGASAQAAASGQSLQLYQLDLTILGAEDDSYLVRQTRLGRTDG